MGEAVNYLQHEWENYRHRDWNLLLVVLAITEDGLRWLNVPWQVLRPIWYFRGRLTEGKTRRLLRRFVRQWAKNGYQSQDYFYDREHQRVDHQGQVVVVNVEWRKEPQ